MFKLMHLALGAAALALFLGTGTRTYAMDNSQDRTAGSSMTTSSGSSTMGQATDRIDWSARWRLTPIEHKRLRAMGLSDVEVFAVANAANESGQYIDDVAQMVLRGRSYPQIAADLEIPYDTLFKMRPEWQTPEWQQGVREGWFTLSQGSTIMAHSRSMNQR